MYRVCVLTDEIEYLLSIPRYSNENLICKKSSRMQAYNALSLHNVGNS